MKNIVITIPPQVTKAWQNQVFDRDFAITQKVTAAELKKETISCDAPQTSDDSLPQD